MDSNYLRKLLLYLFQIAVLTFVFYLILKNERKKQHSCHVQYSSKRNLSCVYSTSTWKYSSIHLLFQ